MPPPMARNAEMYSPQRTHRRTSLRATTPVMDSRNGRFLRGLSRDLSRSGIFVELIDPPPVGTLVDMFIGGVGVGPQILGRVVRIEPGVGFGAAFTGETAAIVRLLHGDVSSTSH
jgi:hypothetical protein